MSEAPARRFSLRAYGSGLAILITGCAPSQTWMEALNCGCNHNLRQTRLHFLAKNSLQSRHLIETPWCWWTNPGSVSQASFTQATHAFSSEPPPEIAPFAGSHNSQVLKFLPTRVMAYLNTCRFSRGITLAAIWDAKTSFYTPFFLARTSTEFACFSIINKMVSYLSNTPGQILMDFTCSLTESAHNRNWKWAQSGLVTLLSK